MNAECKTKDVGNQLGMGGNKYRATKMNMRSIRRDGQTQGLEKSRQDGWGSCKMNDTQFRQTGIRIGWGQ